MFFYLKAYLVYYTMLPQEIIDNICLYMPLEQTWYFSKYATIKIYNPVIHNTQYWLNTDTTVLRYFLKHNIILKNDKDLLCHMACCYGRIDILQLLLNSGMSPKNNNFSICIACCNNQLDTVKFLLNLGCKVKNKYNDFIWLVQSGKCDIIRFLLENKHISVKNDTEYIRIAFDQININTVNLLLEYGSIFLLEDNASCFSMACNFGEFEMVKFFLKHGIDPAINNNAAIKYAKKNNRINIVQLLLEHGCKL